jgi:hypothetical protein
MEQRVTMRHLAGTRTSGKAGTKMQLPHDSMQVPTSPQAVRRRLRQRPQAMRRLRQRPQAMRRRLRVRLDN